MAEPAAPAGPWPANAALDEHGLQLAGIAASDLDTFTHGTTVGTNALIERTGCKVAYVTTKGFEDAPFIQRINRKVLYDLRWTKPAPLVASRRLCLGVEERLDSEGNEVKPVDEAEVRELAARIRESGAEAVLELEDEEVIGRNISTAASPWGEAVGYVWRSKEVSARYHIGRNWPSTCGTGLIFMPDMVGMKGLAAQSAPQPSPRP